MLNLVRPASPEQPSRPAIAPNPVSQGFVLAPEKAPAQAATRQADTSISAFGENGLGSEDLLDTINPLHHLPVIGYLYRKFSGDEIAPAARIAGGALFGGPLGAAFGLLGAAIEDTPSIDNKTLDSTAIAQAQSQVSGRGGWIVNASRQPGLINTTPPRAAAIQAAQVANNVELPEETPVGRPRPGGWIVNAAYQQQPPPTTRLETTA